MKKIIIVGLLFTSCQNSYKNIYFSQSTRKQIANLETLEMWIHDDLEMQAIPEDVADDYLIAVTHTKLSLIKKLRKNDK
jgi:hypothetical protein|tara:strand:- start:654 stop:890 length:237 start_codon:yes stop_codon:yes gene_type:complete